MHQRCVSSRRCRRGSSELVPSSTQLGVSRPDREPVKMVITYRVHTNTLSDLLANRWQPAVRNPPDMEQAGSWTRPDLWVWCGAPRRNRTGDPILTMDALYRLS
jgi:hypothetical protein